MSQDTQSPATHIPDTPGSKRPRTKWARIFGIGCLASILLSGTCLVVLLFSGVLKGSPGDLNASPSWSPDGKRIAFMSDRDGSSDIYIMHADGSNLKQLTSDPFAMLYFLRSALDDTPAWSPDGKRIVFVSGRSNNMMSYTIHDMFTMNIDGTDITQLTKGEVGLAPVWSPDGNQIAFSKEDNFQSVSNITYGIWAMHADGSNLIQLTKDPGNEQSPTYSPDGNKIAFASTQSNQSWDLYVMESDGSNRVQLTDDPSNEGAPTWSPDGKHLAFISDRDGPSRIYVMNADGSNITQLTDNQINYYSPVWSPDGSRIAFVAGENGKTDIFVMNANGSNLVQITGK
jgi:TolB protein